MKFEAGPWHCFGEEIFTKLIELAPTLTQHHPLSTSTQSLQTSDTIGDVNPIDSQQEIRKLPQSSSFIPDYTAVVKDDCTYLEISVNTYLSAYRATLMQRKKRY